MYQINVKTLLGFVLPIVFCCHSCKNDDSQKEYINPKFQKVLSHFKNDTCKEKYLAAQFIINNISNKKSKYTSGIDTIIKKCEAFKIERKKKIKGLSLKISPGVFKNFANDDIDYRLKTDSDSISIKSSFLIEHINETYDAWKEINKVTNTSFEEYCEYILPYRVDDEKFEENTYKVLNSCYNWVAKLLISGSDIKQVLNQLTDSTLFKVNGQFKKRIGCKFSPLQSHKLKFGECYDGVVYYVSILRSVGIPAALEYIPQWGSHHSTGHSLLSVKWNGKWVRMNVGAVGDRFITTNTYRNHCVPKMLRKSFSINENSALTDNCAVDITSEYKLVSDINITLPFSKLFSKDLPVVAVFNRGRTYRILQAGTKSLYKLKFTKLGTNNIYFTGFLNESGFNPLGYPIYIDSLGEQFVLKPDDKLTKQIIVKRKYPEVIYRYPKKKKWCDNLKNCYIEAANDSTFKNSKRLLTFSKVDDPFMKNYKLNTEGKYKYIRFKNNDSLNVSIAEMYFLDSIDQIIEGKIIHEDYFLNKVPRAADGNQLTSYGGNAGFYYGMEFNKPEFVSSINFQRQNDGNHICIGDIYELLYWDKSWKSVATIKAESHTLVFESIPKNCLLWLRNRTTGVEELPFFMDEHGNQYWPGLMK